MTIPDFFDNYHLPDGVHECTISDVEDIFLSNKTRKAKWAQFNSMIFRMEELGIGPEKILINGSFVTGREEPGDVDFAALIPPEKIMKALKSAVDNDDENGIHLFMTKDNQSALRSLFGAHLLIADDEQMLESWSKFFRKGQSKGLRSPDPNKDPDWVKKPDSKGILEINFKLKQVGGVLNYD